MKKIKRKNWIREGFDSGRKYIRDSKRFIFIACILFLIFAILGSLFPVPDYIEKEILKFIEELLSKTKDMSWAQLTSFIFFNNLQSSFFGMIFGAGFGIFSMITILINGYLLGFVSSKVVGTEGLLSLWRLLPHGVFELPAILIAMGLGLRLGTFVFYKKKFEKLKELLINSLKAFFFVIVPLLIIAALIESTLIFLS